MTESLLRCCCLFTFAVHIIIPAAYLWVSPKGFPLTHSRFWLNVVLPVVVALVAVWGVWQLRKRRTHLVATAILLISSGWLGGAVAGRLLFPVSLRGFWALGLVISLCGFALCLLFNRGVPRLRSDIVLVPLCVLAGAFSVWAQLPPPSSTQPLNIAPPTVTQELAAPPQLKIALGEQSSYRPATSDLFVSFEHVRIHCLPRLSFDRISPDGFWSLIAPRNNTRRQLVATESIGEGQHRFAYQDQAIVEVLCQQEKNEISCTTWRTLVEETYSHLNTFALFIVVGHRDLSLSFSPCPEDHIEVFPSDYPTGRPARMAYLDADSEFRVVEATSGEKGPFQQLAAGKLTRGQPLAISLHDQGSYVGTITLEDWTQQLSTNLSPTAGWGLPMNAIEFRRSGDRKQASVEIFVTLAATSVGRGWEAVGHRAGTYRNRMTFSPVRLSNDRSAAQPIKLQPQ